MRKKEAAPDFFFPPTLVSEGGATDLHSPARAVLNTLPQPAYFCENQQGAKTDT